MSNITRSLLPGLLAGLFLAIGLIVTTMHEMRVWLEVSVACSAQKSLKAALIVWRGDVSTEAAILAAKRVLKADLEQSPWWL